MRANVNAQSNRAALTPPSSPNHYTAIIMLTIHRPDPMMLNDNWYYKLCRHWKNNPFPYQGQHGRRRRLRNVERYDTVSTEHTATRHDRCYVDVTWVGEMRATVDALKWSTLRCLLCADSQNTHAGAQGCRDCVRRWPSWVCHGVGLTVIYVRQLFWCCFVVVGVCIALFSVVLFTICYASQPGGQPARYTYIDKNDDD